MGNQRWFAGAMDDIRIYDHVIPVSEIPTIMDDIPVGIALEPRSKDEQTDVYRDTHLGWKPGEFAVKHDIYLGTVWEDVNDATVANPLGLLVGEGIETTTFDPGRLEFETTYYWRVDEINRPPDPTVYGKQVHS